MTASQGSLSRVESVCLPCRHEQEKSGHNEDFARCEHGTQWSLDIFIHLLLAAQDTWVVTSTTYYGWQACHLLMPAAPNAGDLLCT